MKKEVDEKSDVLKPASPTLEELESSIREVLTHTSQVEDLSPEIQKRLYQLREEAKSLLSYRRALASNMRSCRPNEISLHEVECEFYRTLSNHDDFANFMAPTLAPILRAQLYEKLRHPRLASQEEALASLAKTKIEAGFCGTFIDLIHVGQLHGNYFNSALSLDRLYAIARSQWRIIKLILENPEHQVMLEGLDECLTKKMLDKKLVEDVLHCFPTLDISTDFSDLTLPQKHCLAKYQAAWTLLALGKIDNIYPTTTPEFETSIASTIDETMKIQMETYALLLTFVEQKELDQFLSDCLLELVENNSVYMELRELVALEEASKATQNGKGILLYGDSHDMKRWYEPIRYISTHQPEDYILFQNAVSFFKYMQKEAIISYIQDPEERLRLFQAVHGVDNSLAYMRNVDEVDSVVSRQLHFSNSLQQKHPVQTTISGTLYHDNETINYSLVHVKTNTNASIIFVGRVEVVDPAYDEPIFNRKTYTNKILLSFMDYLRTIAKHVNSERLYVQCFPLNERLEQKILRSSIYIGHFHSINQVDVQGEYLDIDDLGEYPTLEIDLNRSPALQNNPFIRLHTQNCSTMVETLIDDLPVWEGVSNGRLSIRTTLADGFDKSNFDIKKVLLNFQKLSSFSTQQIPDEPKKSIQASVLPLDIEEVIAIAKRANQEPETVSIAEHERLEQLRKEAHVLLEMRKAIARDPRTPSPEFIDHCFYNRLNEDRYLCERIAPTLAPILHAALYEKLYVAAGSSSESQLLELAEQKIKTGFKGEFEELIHAAQRHRSYETKTLSLSYVNRVVHSQLCLMLLMMEYPEHHVIVEGYRRNHTEQLLSEDIKQEIRACFPTREIPNDSSLLTAPQKHCILKHHAAHVMLALGHIKAIYSSTDPKIETQIFELLDGKIASQTKTYRAVLPFLSSSDREAFLSDCFNEWIDNPIYFALREHLALEAALSATQGGKGILIYGSGHNFNQWYAPTKRISTVGQGDDVFHSGKKFLKYTIKEEMMRSATDMLEAVIEPSIKASAVENKKLIISDQLEPSHSTSPERSISSSRVEQISVMAEKLKLVREGASLQSKLATERLTDLQRQQCNARLTEIHDEIKRLNRSEVEIIHPNEKVRKLIWSVRAVRLVTENIVLNTSHAVTKDAVAHFLERAGISSAVSEVAGPAAGVAAEVGIARVIFGAGGPQLIVMALLSTVDEAANYMDRHPAETPFGQLSQAAVQVTRDIVHTVFSPLAGATQGMITACQQETIPYESCYSLDDGTTTIPPDLAKKIVNHVLHGIVGAVGESIERLQQDGLKFINAALKIEVNSFDAGGGELVFCPESLTIDPIAKTDQFVSASTKQTAESLVGPLPASNPLANRPAPPSILSQIRYESTIDPFSVKPIFESTYWAHREQLLKPYVMSLLEDNRRDRALNPFVSDDNIPLAQRFLLSTTNMFNPFRSHQIDVHAKVRAAWAIVRHSLRPDARQMYDELQGQLRMEAFVHGQSFGLGYQLSFIDFAAILRNECLVTSYNSFSPYTIRSYAMKFLHDIGGVASRVGLINDLMNSDFQARAELDGVTYCYPVSTFFDETVDLVELCNQMQTIHLKEKDRAFVSIHFNREGEIFTVIPPTLKGTLIERVVVLLDYWMKGFLNGGIFDEQFILNWHKTANHDETYLREHLIDLKRYCRDDAEAKQLQLAYYSLREAMSRFHMNEHAHSVNISEKQPYQTSFRIIARLGELQRHDNMMFPKPEYDIEYTIEETEAYKQFLEQHKARHGHYPDDYEAMKQCTHDFATEVKNTFLKLPFLQNYLDLLGLATVSGYIDLTLDAMGKEVIFKNKPTRLHEPFPEILPPIPVQYFKKLPLKITLQDCLEHLPAEEVNTHLQSLFQEIPMSQFPQLLKPVIQHAIEGLLLEKIQQHLHNTTPVELNDYEVTRMVVTLSMHLVLCCHDIDRIYRERIKEVLYFLTETEHKSFAAMPIVEQVERAKVEVDRFIDRISENQVLADEQTIEAMPEEERATIRNILIQLEREIRKSLESANAAIDKRIAENMESVNKLRGDIGICRQNIASANSELQKFNNQVAQLTAYEQVMNADTIRNARQSITSSIASWNKAIQEREDAIKSIDLENKTLQEKKSENIKNLPEILKIARKEELKRLFQSIKADLHAQLDDIKHSLEHPHRVMLNAMRQATSPVYVTDHYIHMRRGFTNKDLIRETGDTFEIMGGCSIALPNIETNPISEEDALLESVSRLNVQSSEVQYVVQDGQKYAVFNLPIRPKKELQPQQTEAQRYLEALMAEDIEHMPLDLNQLKKPVDEQGAYVLHYASTGLSLAKIQKLMGVDKSQVALADDFGFLAIHVAAHEGRADLVSYFLDIEPSLLNMKSKKGITPLSIAVQVGHIDVLRVLLSRGANPHVMLHNGLFPLHNSIENHFPDIALLLLSYLTPEQAGQAMESGMTPLHLAIRQELDTVAMALIQKGVCLTATLKANGYTPFHMAVEQGKEKLVEAMILPYPALSKLTSAEFAQLKAFFINYKFFKEGDTTTTPFTTQQVIEFKRILKYWPGNSFEKKILEHPLLSFKLPSGDSVFHVAANAGEIAQKVVQLLIKQGASVDVENALHETPLTRSLMSRSQYTMISALSTATPKRLRHEKPFLSLAIETNQLNWVQTRAFRTCQQEVMPSDGLAIATRYNNLWTANQISSNQTVLVKEGIYEAVIVESHALPNLAAHYGHFYLMEHYFAQFDFEKIRKDKTPKVTSLVRYAVAHDEIGFIREYIKTPLDALMLAQSMAQIAACYGSVKCLQFFLDCGVFTQSFMQSLLVVSIENNRFEVAELLLSTKLPKRTIFSDNQAKLTVNAPIKNEETALHLCMRSGSLKLLALLLNMEADVSLRNEYRQTAFHLAIEYFDEEMLAYLFEHSKPALWPRELLSQISGPEYKAMRAIIVQHMKRIPKNEWVVTDEPLIVTPDESNSPLHLALMLRQFEVAHALIEATPRLVLSRNKKLQTPLMLAAGLGREDLVDVMITNHLRLGLFSLDAVDRDGNHVAHYAIKSGNQHLVMKFMDMGAWAYRPNRLGKTPLMLAAIKGLTLVIENYRKANVDNERDDKGFNALHYAALYGKIDSVKALTCIASTIDERVQKTQSTALHLAAYRGHASVVTFLIERGASITLRDNEGFSVCEHLVFSKKMDMHRLLHQLPSYHQRSEHPRLLKAAIMAKNERVLKELILAEASLSGQDEEGNTLLHLAAMNDASSCSAILIESNEIYLDQYNLFGYTALQSAAHFGHVGILEQLIEAGSDLDKKTKSGQSALYLSITGEHLGVLICLLKYAACLEDKTPEGLTLAQYALSKGQTLMAAYLVHWGKDTGCSKEAIDAIANPAIKESVMSQMPAFHKALQQLSSKPKALIARARFGLLASKKPLTVNPYPAEEEKIDVPTVVPAKVSNFATECLSTIGKLPIHQLTVTERYGLTAMLQFIRQTPNQDEDMPAFTAQALIFRETFGKSSFYLLFGKVPVTPCTFKQFSALLQQIQDLKDEHAVYQVMREYGTHRDVGRLEEALGEIYQIWFDKKYPERPLDEVLNRFSQTAHPLPLSELEQIKLFYKSLIAYRTTLQHETKERLIQLTAIQRQQLPQRGVISIKPELLASIIQLMQKLYHIRLYDTQILAILALLQKNSALSGRILQINTGEGKSAILAVVSTYLASFGYTIDTINTSDYLATRDFSKYQSLFKAVGVEKLVAYVTSRQLIFEKLGDDFRNQNQRGERQRDIVLIDEVDSLFLDKALSSAYIAVRGQFHYSWIYAPIYLYVQSAGQDANAVALRDKLSRFEFGKYQKQLDSISDNRLERWIKSALSAMNEKKRDVDYLVRRTMDSTKVKKRDDIVIIDRLNTGQCEDGCQWQDGLHQFLQFKEKLDITPENLTAGMTSYGALLKEYRVLYGVTGSIGEACERDEILTLFGADSYDIPPHFEKQLTVLPPQIVETKLEQYERIYTALTQVKNSRQPALVTLYSIAETKAFSEFLRLKDPLLPQQVIDGTDTNLASILIANATRPNMVNITTNFGGRGIDFVLTEKAVAVGGLFNIMTLFSDNLRAEIQSEGRSARQGEQGVVLKILSLEDPFFLSLPEVQQAQIKLNLKETSFSQEAIAQTLEQLTDWRRYKTQMQSNTRVERAKEEAWIESKQKQFAEMNRELNITLNDESFTTQVLQFMSTFTAGDYALSDRPLTSRMSQLSEQAALLFNQSTAASWFEFYKQFKVVYLEDMLYCWTEFNEGLKEHQHLSKSDVDVLFSRVESELAFYASEPKDNVLMWLAKVLEHAAFVSQTRLSEAVEYRV